MSVGPTATKVTKVLLFEDFRQRISEEVIGQGLLQSSQGGGEEWLGRKSGLSSF